MSPDQFKKKFVDTALLNGELKQIIFQDPFLVSVVDFGVFKIKLELTFFQSTFRFTFCYVEYLLISQIFCQCLLDGIRNLLYDIWWVV